MHSEVWMGELFSCGKISYLRFVVVTSCDFFLCFRHVRRHLKSPRSYVLFEVIRMQNVYEMKRNAAMAYYEGMQRFKQI